MKTCVLFALVAAIAAPCARAQEAEPAAGLVALHQALLDASTSAVVLNVAAHPDDESSRTNALLRRKYGMRVVTVYTTYGDGGQNAIGREIGPELAALRVRETLRASAMSGVEVRWLGMDDFGFSKTLEETLAKWGEAELRAAMRKVVDEVDPDFVLTNHSLTQGHGHHRASYWAITEVLNERAAQKAPRVLPPEVLAERAAKEDVRVPPLLARCKLEEAQWIVDPSELEAARGESYARLAHRAWVQHVTQGPWGPHNPLQVAKDFWRVTNGEQLAPHANNGDLPPMPWCWVRDTLGADDRLSPQVATMPREAMVAAVRAHLRKLDAALIESPYDEAHARRLGAKFRQADALRRALLALANVRVEVWLERDEVPVGGEGKANVVVHGAERLQNLKVVCGSNEAKPVQVAVRPTPFDGAAPAGKPAPPPPPPQTYPGRLAVQFAAGELPNGPETRFAEIVATFELDGEHFWVTERRPYTPVLPIELQWDREVLLVPKGRVVERTLSATVKSHREQDSNLPVRLSMGPGIQATSIPGRVQLTREHNEARILVRATITADELAADAGIEVGFGEHAARLPLRAIHITVPEGLRVGLVRGPDDTVENTLADLGVPFTALDRDALAITRLDDFPVMLLDMRAYHHRPELAELRDRILQYCRGGGRVVAMYHKSNEWNERAGHPLLAPFPMTIADERVTEEDCAVTFLQPQHALLQRPHAITASDFEGWVQERGLNFPKTWDPAWTPPLSMKDRGDEKPHEGALLYTQYGKGDFVYCSLVLYRQLRVGHAGAARLLVNLLAR